MDSVYPAVSGAVALEKRLEIVSNNVANVGTTGFKKSFPLYNGLNDPQVGLQGSSVAFEAFDRIVTDFTPGPVRDTGRPLDLAIEGEGFFAVQTPDGVRYTRNGQFSMDEQGRLITAGGFPVLGAGGPITIPEGRLMIDTDGRISVQGTEVNAQPIEVDTLPVMVVDGQDSLVPVGDSLYRTINGAGARQTEGRMLQGALEGSNVNAPEEMVAMIQVLRLYEAIQKSILTADEAAAKTATDVGKV